MPAQKYAITLEQGATFELPVTYYEDPNQQVVIDLTGYTAKVQIRKSADASSVVYTGTSAGPSPHITLDNQGRIHWEVPAAASWGLPAPFTGVYDLILTDADGKVTRLLEGPAVISPGVTRG